MVRPLFRTVSVLTLFIIGLFAFAGSSDSETPDGLNFTRDELFFTVRDVNKEETDYSLPPKFEFPTAARDSSTFGIDVSRYTRDACQCDIKWDNIAASKVSFAYLRATQGIKYVDPTFATNKRSITANPKHVYFGAYHFLTSDNDPMAQVKHFLDTLGAVDAVNLPPSLDLEWHLGEMTDDCYTNATVRVRRADGSIKHSAICGIKSLPTK
jgi:GH25 family lysozyme M1 (1,4-beta-N-acetylmuramidase)